MTTEEAVLDVIAAHGPLMGPKLIAKVKDNYPLTDEQIDIAIAELACKTRICWADKGWVKR